LCLNVVIQSIQNCDSPGNRRDSLRLQKDSLKQQQVDAEQSVLEQHRSFMDLELRKLRRCKLLQMHLLDQSLFCEVCLPCCVNFFVCSDKSVWCLALVPSHRLNSLWSFDVGLTIPLFSASPPWSSAVASRFLAKQVMSEEYNKVVFCCLSHGAPCFVCRCVLPLHL